MSYGVVFLLGAAILAVLLAWGFWIGEMPAGMGAPARRRGEPERFWMIAVLWTGMIVLFLVIAFDQIG